MRIALAQINPTVGDLQGNTRMMLEKAREAYTAGADVVAFPELALCGYPPEDLLLRDHFLAGCHEALLELAAACADIVTFVGVPLVAEGAVFNGAAILAGGALAGSYRKIWLPNYAVFDEKRYFEPGDRVVVVEMAGIRVGVNVCEDVWEDCGPTVTAASAGGAQIVVNLSMSPYHMGKGKERESMLAHRAREAGTYLCYLNGVGGQDELVFDGQTLVFNPQGGLVARACQFEEQMLFVEIDPVPRPIAGETACEPSEWPIEVVHVNYQPRLSAQAEAPPENVSSSRIVSTAVAPTPAAASGDVASGSAAPGDTASGAASAAVSGAASGDAARSHVACNLVGDSLSVEAEVYAALRLGVRDYLAKNGFHRAVLGLSGGVDSALTACIAADALGSGSVTAISMPSRYSSPGTQSDARETAERLGINFHEIPIENLYRAYLESLAPYLKDAEPGVAQQNIQARIRGNLIMALSNKFGWLVLTTGNKSEMAVGYATLYGDMAGGFAVLKDVPKTLVYRLAAYRNSLGPDPGPIPESTITRAPSAELAPHQVDQDTLPPYEILDQIIEAYVVRDESVEEIEALGIDGREVRRVVAMIDGNEYKRRQAPPGIRITPKAFGKDRRLPITNRYRG